jgi:hypothetical protein
VIKKNLLSFEKIPLACGSEQYNMYKNDPATIRIDRVPHILN